MLSKVEIWDDLGWIIAKGNVSPKEISNALDVELAAARAARETTVLTTEGSVPPPSPLPTVTCDLKSDRGPVHTGNGCVTFGIRLLRPENASFDSRRGERATDGAASSNTEAGDEATTRLSQTVQSIENGKAVRSVDSTTSVQGGTTDVQHASNTTNSAGDQTGRGNAGRVFDEINELLGLTSNGSASGSGMSTSSPGAASTGSGTGDSGGFSFVLGDGLLGSVHQTSVDDLVGESWSSVEEGPLATPGQSRRGSDGGLVEGSRKPTASPAVSTSENEGAPLDRNRVGGEVDPPAASLTLAENAAGTVVSCNPSDGVDTDDYSDDDFDCDGASGGAEGPLDVRSLFSCSSASSSASLTLENEERSVTAAEARGAPQHEREEMAVGAAARILRRRLRRAAERCGGGNLGAKAALLFNKLDEVR